MPIDAALPMCSFRTDSHKAFEINPEMDIVKMYTETTTKSLLLRPLFLHI